MHHAPGVHLSSTLLARGVRALASFRAPEQIHFRKLVERVCWFEPLCRLLNQKGMSVGSTSRSGSSGRFAAGAGAGATGPGLCATEGTTAEA